MMASNQHERLVVLAADRDIEEAMRAVLYRPESLGIRSVRFDCQRHPNRDPGCRLNAAEFLRPFQIRFTHALVVFDREGCGSSEERGAIERNVDAELANSGWGSRGRAIVIDPELEAWLWSDSPVVVNSLGWDGRYAELQSWLRAENVWDRADAKPHRPKAALNRTLGRTRRRRSARLYGEIAAKVSLAHCHDPAFTGLRTVLQGWFPAPLPRP